MIRLTEEEYAELMHWKVDAGNPPWRVFLLQQARKARGPGHGQ